MKSSMRAESMADCAYKITLGDLPQNNLSADPEIAHRRDGHHLLTSNMIEVHRTRMILVTAIYAGLPLQLVDELVVGKVVSPGLCEIISLVFSVMPASVLPMAFLAERVEAVFPGRVLGESNK